MNISTARQLSSFFYRLDAEMADTICSDPRVAMTPSALMALKDFFNTVQFRSPSAGEFVFLDAFFGSRITSPDRYAAVEMVTKDRYIAETLADAMKRYNHHFPDYTSPCTLKGLFELSFNAVAAGKTREFSMSDIRLFAAANDEIATLRALINGCIPEYCNGGICFARSTYVSRHRIAPSKRRDYSVAIVYSNDGSEKLLEFARRASSKRGAVYLNVEKVEDIFNTIRTLSRGLKINADALPCIDPIYENDDAPEDDPFINISKALFEDKIFGKHAILIVGKRWFVRPFTALAKQLGLGVCSAITITKAPVFSIKSGKSTLSEMRAGIFDAIDSCTRIKTRTSDEKTSDLLLPKVEKKNCDSSRDESVYLASSPLSSDSFRSALTAVSAPIIYAAMDGYSTRNSALSIAVSLVGDIGTPDSSSQLFSAVLGVYRAVTELGLPSDAFSVSLEKGQPRITAALHSAPFSKKANISSSLTVDEMLSLLFPVGDEPKFEVIRDLSNGENITFENIVI